MTISPAIYYRSAPNLPLAPAQYDPRMLEAENQMLRTYFTNLDNAIQQLISVVAAMGETTGAASDAAVALSTGVDADVASVALPRGGRYLAVGTVTFTLDASTTLSEIAASVSLESGVPAAPEARVCGAFTTGASQTLTSPPRQVTGIAGDRVYLVARADFGVSTAQAEGQLLLVYLGT